MELFSLAEIAYVASQVRRKVENSGRKIARFRRFEAGIALLRVFSDVICPLIAFAHGLHAVRYHTCASHLQWRMSFRVVALGWMQEAFKMFSIIL